MGRALLRPTAFLVGNSIFLPLDFFQLRRQNHDFNPPVLLLPLKKVIGRDGFKFAVPYGGKPPREDPALIHKEMYDSQRPGGGKLPIGFPSRYFNRIIIGMPFDRDFGIGDILFDDLANILENALAV